MRSPPFLALVIALVLQKPLAGAAPLVFITSFNPGDAGAIQSYSLDSVTGTLDPLHHATAIEYPYYLALSPDQRFLYSIRAEHFDRKDPQEVAAFRLDGRSGVLQPLNRQSTRGSASCFLWVERTGQTLLAANYSSGSIASFPVHADGSLGEVKSFIEHTGPVFDQVRQQGPHPHAIIPSPDNRFVFVPDLGLDQVAIYQLDAATSTLTPHDPPFVKAPQRAGPRHLAFHPDGNHLYVINEIANSVTLYDYEPGAGVLTRRDTLSTLPPDYHGTSNCADVRITPDGKFLYASNRTHDSIAAYRIAANGALSLIGIEPSRGKGPQDLCITPDGKWLLCANMPGNNVATFRLDPTSGRLQPAGEPISISKPSCILLVP